MKKFQIKSALAAGLAHRLNTLDAQVVVDACKIDAIPSVRANQRIVKKIVEANAEFETAISDTESKKRAIHSEIQAEYKAAADALSTEESAKLGRELTAKFNAKAADIQKESKANPETIIIVELSDDDYEKILIPVFNKTVQLWDVNGDGNGQKLFLEVADALESAVTTFYAETV